jgi:hypothetical protein
MPRPTLRVALILSLTALLAGPARAAEKGLVSQPVRQAVERSLAFLQNPGMQKTPRILGVFAFRGGPGGSP